MLISKFIVLKNNVMSHQGIEEGMYGIQQNVTKGVVCVLNRQEKVSHILGHSNNTWHSKGGGGHNSVTKLNKCEGGVNQSVT